MCGQIDENEGNIWSQINQDLKDKYYLFSFVNGIQNN